MMYASLIGPLLGIFYPLPTTDETEARWMLRYSKLDKLWCAVYTREGAEASIAKHGGMILSDDYAQRLDYDSRKVQSSMQRDRGAA